MFPISNPISILGFICFVLVLISLLQKTPFKIVFNWVPPVIFYYFLPAIAVYFDIIDTSESPYYHVISRYFLPAAIFLFCISMDIKILSKLGYKILVIFFVSMLSIIIGGPLSLYVFSLFEPSVLSIDWSLWKGLSTISASWIGGSVNQIAVKEILDVPNTQFSIMVVIDVLVQNISFIFLLYGIQKQKRFNKWFGANQTQVDTLMDKVEKIYKQYERKTVLRDLLILFGVTFLGVSISHFFGGNISSYFHDFIASKDIDSIWQNFTTLGSAFFWMIIFITLLGIIMSFTSFKKFEGIGASQFGSFFIYLLVIVMGMEMNIEKLVYQWDIYKYAIGICVLWIVFHLLCIVLVSKFMKIPFIYMAIGSQANLGGAASVSVVANAYHSKMVPIGVTLSVLGYALGTYSALISSFLMQMMSI